MGEKKKKWPSMLGGKNTIINQNMGHYTAKKRKKYWKSCHSGVWRVSRDNWIPSFVDLFGGVCLPWLSAEGPNGTPVTLGLNGAAVGLGLTHFRPICQSPTSLHIN